MAQYKGKKTPQEVVEREFAKINRRYFGDSIIAEPVLEVPPRAVTVSVENPSRKIEEGSEAAQSLQQGLQLALDGKQEEALKLLEPLAERRYKDAIEAVLHIYRANHRNFRPWAAMLNSLDRRINRYPAACIDTDINKIYIHPMIGESECPRFVMSYLLHHEMLHLEFPSDTSNPHPPEFMERERAFPKRDQALSWLRRHEFPTMEL